METLQTTDYQKQATDFLNKHGIKFSSSYVDHKPYFMDDKDSRDIYKVTFKRDSKQFSLRFGQSIANTGSHPTPYDVLASLTKYDPYSFESFCSDYGYDTDSRKSEKVYNAVQNEWRKMNNFFTSEELTELQDIN